MAIKSVPTAVAQVPLDKFAPSIYDVARYANDDSGMLHTIAKAIGVIAEIGDAKDHELMHKLWLIRDLAKIGKHLGDDLRNLRDCQIADCMLASEDPNVRAEARP